METDLVCKFWGAKLGQHGELQPVGIETVTWIVIKESSREGGMVKESFMSL